MDSDSSPNSDQPNRTPVENSNNEENSPGIRSSISENRFQRFFCIRTRRAHIRSTHQFNFQGENDIALMSAKTHGFLGNTVYVGNPNGVHVKTGEYQYVIVISKQKSLFTLHQGSETGEVLSNITISTDYGEYIGPRKIGISTPSATWNSEIPKRKPNGHWQLNFHGQFTITSCKNAIILDEHSSPVIIIRKIEKNTLELNVFHETPNQVLFALGISSFLYPN